MWNLDNENSYQVIQDERFGIIVSSWIRVLKNRKEFRYRICEKLLRLFIKIINKGY